jgi:hypothetical protein
VKRHIDRSRSPVNNADSGKMWSFLAPAQKASEFSPPFFSSGATFRQIDVKIHLVRR